MWPTIPLEKFLENPLAAIREIASSDKIFLITENGKPILDLRPYRSVPIEKLRGSVIHSGDIVSPLDPDGYGLSKDPADRIIVATAMLLNIPVVTVDRTIRAYPHVQTIW